MDVDSRLHEGSDADLGKLYNAVPERPHFFLLSYLFSARLQAIALILVATHRLHKEVS